MNTTAIKMARTTVIARRNFFELVTAAITAKYVTVQSIQPRPLPKDIPENYTTYGAALWGQIELKAGDLFPSRLELIDTVVPDSYMYHVVRAGWHVADYCKLSDLRSLLGVTTPANSPNRGFDYKLSLGGKEYATINLSYLRAAGWESGFPVSPSITAQNGTHLNALVEGESFRLEGDITFALVLDGLLSCFKGFRQSSLIQQMEL